jgi:hypothetical protein
MLIMYNFLYCVYDSFALGSCFLLKKKPTVSVSKSNSLNRFQCELALPSLFYIHPVLTEMKHVVG